MANDASLNPEVAMRIAKEKSNVIEALKEMPIAFHACRKAGVSPATYYRWRTDDREFRRACEDALTQGIEYVNDLTESQLITLIKEKKMPAIALWLKNNHKRYGAKTQSYTPIAERGDLSPEEQRIVADALRIASGGVIQKQHHAK